MEPVVHADRISVVTCIVGVARDGQVLLGGDSAATCYDDHEIHAVGNSKVLRVGPYALGYTTSFRLGNSACVVSRVFSTDESTV